MSTQKCVYWRNGNWWLGFLEEFPDYWTQGETEIELKANLLDLYKDLAGGAIENVRRVAELEVQ